MSNEQQNTAIFLDKVTDQSVKYSPSLDEEKEFLNQYARFLESFTIGVCLFNPDGILEYVNGNGCELLLAKSADALIGTKFSAHFNIDDDQHKYFLKKYIGRDWSPLPIKVFCVDGTTLNMQANITFSNTNPPNIVTVFFRAK